MKKPLRILHLEDEPKDAELVREALECFGLAPEIKVVQTKADYLAQLDRGWDLILADYSLPQFDGMQALELAKARGLDTSVIIVSGTLGEEASVAAMKAGASDYVMKDHLARLGPAIERGLQESDECRERRQSAVYHQLSVTVLEIINEDLELQDVIHRVLATIKQATGCDAVGIRVQEGEDFPYLAETGFSVGHLLTEDTLVGRDAEGELRRNKDGALFLECTCGLVLSGKGDPANPLFTKGGSFWTNDSKSLLDLATDQDPRLHPRNRCIHDGYASMALIPIRNQMGIIGLLQLNSRKANSFTLANIESLEGIASRIGEALMRRQAEQELRTSNRQLKEALAQLKAAQDQLVQQERISALGQMASGIAHDFNNVLTPILGFSEILLNEPGVLDDPQEVVHLVENIYRAGDQAKEIVNRLSEFYKAGGQIEVEPVDIVELVNRVIELTEPKWKVESEGAGRTVEIRTSLGDLPLIEAEKSSLRDAFTNLIFNAVDAMPEGGTIMIACQSLGESVEIMFSDTGVGMTSEVVKRCLEPFYSTKGPCGSGQGLAIVSTVVTRHKGTIEVESEPGKGTFFTITLPIHSPDSIRKEEAAVLAGPVPQLRILAVDDEAVVLQLLVRVLSKDQHVVDTAQSGADGLEKAAAGDYDLFILDRALGDMSGDQLAVEMKRLHPNVPVIQLTGFAAEPRDCRGELPGVDAVVDKPATRQALQQAILKVIRQR